MLKKCLLIHEQRLPKSDGTGDCHPHSCFLPTPKFRAASRGPSPDSRERRAPSPWKPEGSSPPSSSSCAPAGPTDVPTHVLSLEMVAVMKGQVKIRSQNSIQWWQQAAPARLCLPQTSAVVLPSATLQPPQLPAISGAYSGAFHSSQEPADEFPIHSFVA